MKFCPLCRVITPVCWSIHLSEWPPSRCEVLWPSSGDIWTCLPACQSAHRCWARSWARRCQSSLPLADRHAATCSCRVSPDSRGRTELTQHHLSGWTLIFLLLPVLFLLIASDVSQGTLAPVIFPLSLPPRGSSKGQSRLELQTSVTVARALTHSLCIHSLPVFLLFFLTNNG